jgi:hypothetical protein
MDEKKIKRDILFANLTILLVNVSRHKAYKQTEGNS